MCGRINRTPKGYKHTVKVEARVVHEIRGRASTLPPEPIAPTLARAPLAAIGSGLSEAVASDVELLTSEVVSNAVKHANLDPSQEIILRIVSDGYIRVEVVDPGLPFEADLRRSREHQGSSAGDCSSSTRSRRRGVSNPTAPARRCGSRSGTS